MRNLMTAMALSAGLTACGSSPEIKEESTTAGLGEQICRVSVPCEVSPELCRREVALRASKAVPCPKF